MPSRKAKSAMWTKARNARNLYASRLRAVARQVGLLVKGLSPTGNPADASKIGAALRSYAQTIQPWAESVAAAMLADVARRDKAMWRANSVEMGKRLRTEIQTAPTGAMLGKLQAGQVQLIQSIPLDAAVRVHHLAQEAQLNSQRASEVAKMILNTEDVSLSKATLIARTEVARASSNLVQARAQYAGSVGYIWRTSDDGDVRDSHAKMEGQYVQWSAPPTLDKMTGHAGTLPNCRCFAEPIFPED